MPPSGFKSELAKIGHTMNRWKAELVFVLFVSGALFTLFLGTLGDVYMQYHRVTRFVVWILLGAIIVMMFRFIGKCFIEKHTMMGMAAVVELKFPELDNHLINFLQFSMSVDNDPFKKEYVKRGVPEWRQVKISRMKNKKLHSRAKLALALTIIIMVIPFFVDGKVWGVSLWRVINPFSNVQPVTMSLIVDVRPGEGSALIGERMELFVDVTGKKKGHEVHIDIEPAGNKKMTYKIGSIKTANTTNTYRYTYKKVTSDFKYRFRAGDSPSPKWYKIKSRTPLSVSSMELKVTPPGYTKAKVERYDGLGDEIIVLEGSDVEMEVKCTAKLTEATVTIKDAKPVKLLKSGNSWKGIVKVNSGGGITLQAKDIYGDELETNIKYTLVKDDPPTVEVISPKGKAMLPPGSDPLIEFAVVDDYGLKSILVEKLERDKAGKKIGNTLKTWELHSPKDFSKLWRHEMQAAEKGETLMFRVTAIDNNPYKTQPSRSQSIVFSSMTTEKAMAVKENFRDKATAGLSSVVNMQRENISRTKKYEKNSGIAKAQQWTELADTQEKIKKITKELIDNPAKPLGNMTESIQKTYVADMPEAVRLLEKVAIAGTAEKTLAIQKALASEEKILRVLMNASSVAAQVQAQEKTSMLSALLNNIINGQSGLVKKTKSLIELKSKAPSHMVDSQEDLGIDLSEFVTSCNREATTLGEDQKPYSDTLLSVAAMCKSLNVKGDIMVATDRLDSGALPAALVAENSALTKLKDIRVAFEQQKIAVEEDRLELMQDVLQDMNSKIAEAKELMGLAVESMEVVDPNKNKNDKEVDMMEEEAAELNKNLKESMLEVPIDLCIFADLNVANDLCEEVIQVFEEVVQKPESGDALIAMTKADEALFAKELAMAEDMQETGEAGDHLESWLGGEPAADTANLREALDQEEMPPEGMALGALQAQVEDLISDLLETTQDPDDEELAADSPTNAALSDPETGGPVVAGETASFAAAGKTGNEAPEHKEQDGRSNVGRQGMSNGECAAGSGTIQEGDPNMEERRTDDPSQSGQVDLDGEADTKATGGGKQGSGEGDEFGMTGGTERMDSTTSGNADGLAQMMKKCDNMYAKAEVNGVKTQSIKEAAHFLAQAKDAIVKKRPLSEIEEWKQLAIGSLKKAETELSSGLSMTLDSGATTVSIEDVIDTGTTEAPERYKDLVSEYYKVLSSEI